MINIERRDKIDIITFTVNRINALITEELGSRLGKLFDNANARVVIDLKGVDYMDSSGFCCFLAVLKAARHNFGILKFVNPEPKVTDMIKILNLHTVFQIYPDLDTCLRSF